MPRKYRISDAGFYHVINRGVERRVVFIDEEDCDTFLDILNSTSRQYKLFIHAFVLMNNHYHILLETTKENISDAIKFLNGSYSIYFNKKYRRSGHLWQGRFFSNFLFDEEHFWIIAKYIERNPIKASMVKELKDYKYQSLFQYMHKYKYFELIKNSKILQMPINKYYSFLDSQMSEEFVEKVHTEPKKIKDKNNNLVILDKRIEYFFEDDIDINKKNNIKKAYNYGYKKAEIANYLGISSAAVSKYFK